MASLGFTCKVLAAACAFGFLLHVSMPVVWHRVRLSALAAPTLLAFAVYTTSSDAQNAVLDQCAEGLEQHEAMAPSKLLSAIMLLSVTLTIGGGYLAHFAYKGFVRRVHVIEGELLGRLADGTIRLLSVPWLLSQPEQWRLHQRQELPPDAFVPEAAAIALLEKGSVAAVSCRWLHDSHPDPSGLHLAAVRSYLSSWWQPGVKALFWE